MTIELILNFRERESALVGYCSAAWHACAACEVLLMRSRKCHWLYFSSIEVFVERKV